MGCTGSKTTDETGETAGRSSRRGRGRGSAGEDNWDGKIREVEAWRLDGEGLSTAHLERLRIEFWETRVEGRAEMWQALRAAAEADSDDLRNEIIAAVGLKPASKGATLLAMYDELGALYEVPMYCLRAPQNLDVEPCFTEFKYAAQAVKEHVDGMSASARANATL